MEHAHLAQADRHILSMERLITGQELRIVEIGARNEDVREAERLLQNMKDTLRELYVHRQLIIERLDANQDR